MKDINLQDFGVEIAEKLSWDGRMICEVFLEALTDANYHKLRKELELIINDEFEYKHNIL